MLHTTPIVSFAVSPDEKLLATGSGNADGTEAEAPIVLWDVSSGRAIRSVEVEGGVGLADQLRDGLQFSKTGRFLGFNHFTDLIGVFDVASGKVTLDVGGWGVDGAPRFVFSDDEKQVFVSMFYEDKDELGVLIDVDAGEVGYPDSPMRRIKGHRSSPGVAMRGNALHVLDDGTLVTFELQKGTVTRRVPVRPRGRLARTSPSRRLIAIAADTAAYPGDFKGVDLIEIDTGRRVFFDPAPPVDAFVFSTDEKKVAAIAASSRKGGPPHAVVLYEGSKKTGAIPGPLATSDFFYFADGVPFTYSPDAGEGLVVRPGGGLERWSVAGAPRLIEALPKPIDGATAVVWPLPEIAVALAPTLIAFVHMPDGSVIATHRFPQRPKP